MELTVIDAVRLEVNARLDTERKAALGQFMTPSATAIFMAGLFSPPIGAARLLDAGAGVGSLSSSFLDRFPETNIFVEAYEVDSVMRRYLEATLARHEAKHPHIHSKIFKTDFIHTVVRNLMLGKGTRFTHAILNPPYAKISSKSEHRLLLREVGIETVNLYTAFVALTILLMEPQGEIVAIIPRSFCNGTYYRPFRELLLKNCAIRQLHLFESRRAAFKDDKVLQENIIIHLVKGGSQGPVNITTSFGSEFEDVGLRSYPYADIVNPVDPERFVRIPTHAEEIRGTTSHQFTNTLKEIGVEVCTGPVVDFRLKKGTRESMEPGGVPLLYPHHFQKRQLDWPKVHKKPNVIVVSAETERWLMPAGWYVIVRRITSKEEKRRIVAYVVDPNELPGDKIGFENHWNVFHTKKSGLDKPIALGLAVYLNTTAVDDNFRIFSGHTQVNATDLRNMKYPTLNQLRKLGEVAGHGGNSHDAITKNPCPPNRHTGH